jgi:HTH-type transcriptional regulator, transcriptional repressor of NAD biosynthesis genes
MVAEMSTDPIDRYATGLIVGRFCPPHLGHRFVIGWAAQRCEQLVVYVNTRQGEAVPGALRAQWLQEMTPEATVVEVAHDLNTDFSDEALWRRWVTLFRDRWPLPAASGGPHAVFSSDPYVDELARRLGAEAVVVDPDRAAVPISATLIREYPADYLDYLAAPVRAWVEQNWVAPSA